MSLILALQLLQLGIEEYSKCLLQNMCSY